MTASEKENPYFAAMRRPASCVSSVNGIGEGQRSRIAASASSISCHDIPSFRGAAIARHFELAFPGDPDLDLVTFLEIEGFNDGGGKADRQAVAPLRDLHAEPPLTSIARTTIPSSNRNAATPLVESRWRRSR